MQSITHSECVSVSLRIQHAMCMRRIVVCSQSGSTTFFYIISQKHMTFEKKVIENKMCFDFLYHFCLKYF